MSTPYYTHSSTPILGSLGSSSLMRAEFTAIDVALQWKDYNGYPEYAQGPLPFEHGTQACTY